MDQKRLDEILSEHADEAGALLPILHAVQDAFGHVPADSVAPIAKALHLSRAEVHGVITYYHHFRTARAGRTVVQLCRAEACQARGADQLVAHAIGAIGCGMHETSADGAVTLEAVYCLGHCATGPNIQIGDRLYGRVSIERFSQLIATSRADAGQGT